MGEGRLVEAVVHYRCGCSTHHPAMYTKYLALYVQACREHSGGVFGDAGRRERIDVIREVSAEEEMAMAWAKAFAMGSVYDAQFEDQDVRRF